MALIDDDIQPVSLDETPPHGIPPVEMAESSGPGCFLWSVVGVLALGFFALLALAFIGAIVAITRALARAAHHGGSAAAAHSGDARVLEGEFVVLNDTASLNH